MIERLIAESEINGLHARLQDAVWRQDLDGFADCFSHDATWKIAGRVIHGRTDIRAFLANALSLSTRVMIFTGIPILEIEGDKASGRVSSTEYVKRINGEAVRTLGVFYDRYVKVDGRWRISWRHFAMHYYGPPDFSAPFFDAADFGPPPSMPTDDDPTMVRTS